MYQTVVEDPHALSPYPTQAVAPQPTTRHRPVAPKQPGMSIPLIDPLFFAQGQFLVPGYAPMMPMAGMGNGQEWARAAGAYQQSNGVMGAPVPNGQINMQRVISQNGYFVSAPFANTGPQQMMLVPQPAVAKVPQKSMKSAGMPSTNRNVASSPGQIMRPDPKRRNSDFRTQIEAVTSQEGAADPATQAHSSRDKAQVARTDTENMRIHYSRMDLNDSAHVATSSPRESERMDTSESISSSSAAGNVSAEVSSSSSTNNIPAAAQIVSETSRILSQNLARLAFLVRQMETPTGYEVACKELVAWCDDQRAYAPSLCGDLNHTFEVPDFFNARLILTSYNRKYSKIHFWTDSTCYSGYRY